MPLPIPYQTVTVEETETVTLTFFDVHNRQNTHNRYLRGCQVKRGNKVIGRFYQRTPELLNGVVLQKLRVMGIDPNTVVVENE